MGHTEIVDGVVRALLSVPVRPGGCVPNSGSPVRMSEE